MAEVLDIRGGDEQAVARAVTRAAETVADGQLVVIPDEAGYHMVGSIVDPSAAESLLRPTVPTEPSDSSNVLPGPVVLGPDAASVLGLASVSTDSEELVQRLSRRCWPAPVVMNLVPQATPPDNCSASWWTHVTDTGQLPVRVPAHEVPRGLLDLADTLLLARPLDLTDSGDPNPGSCDSAALILQAGPSRFAGGDTTVRIRENKWDVTHEGAVGAATVARMACRAVVFVCTGNTCRSPMAEALFRKMLAERLQCRDEELVDRGFLVGSAGVAAYGGSPISLEAAESLRERGIDFASHVSQPLTAELAVQADHLVTMTSGHRDSILEAWPDAASRVRLLDINGADIDDPIGGPSTVYAECCQAIQSHIHHLLDELLDDSPR